MKFVIDGFRPLYKNFCVFGMSDVFRTAVEGQEAADSANCVMTYGYIDHEKGLMLEVMACAFYTDDQKISYKPVSDDKRITVELEKVKDQIFEFAGYGDSPLADTFKNKVEAVAEYSANAEYETIRSMQWLDGFRYNQYIDDVLVEMMCAGKNIEKAFVRTEKVGDQCVLAKLLVDTKKCGYKKGDVVSIYMDGEPGKGKLVVDVTPDNVVSRDELKDTKLLADAIETFMNDKSQDNLVELLEVLRDSNVVIPCIASLSEEDRKRLAAAKMVYENDMEKVKAVYKNKDKLELVPSIMKKDDKSYFPAFLTKEDMTEYGEEFAKVSVPFIEVLNSAKKGVDSIEGIIINPFSQAIVIPQRMIEVAVNLKSRLI